MSRKSSKANLWNIAPHRSSLPLAVLLAGVVVCILAWFWQYGVSVEETNAPVPSESSVRINEVMSSNRSALLDDKGNYSDWIELLNTSDHPVDITGWKMSDGNSLFTFPRHVLGAGETVLVFASDSHHAIEGEVYHAPFKLSASGENVTLTNALEQNVDTVELPALEPNTSYSRNIRGEWEVTFSFTPDLNNDEEYIPAEELVSTSGLVISEVMPRSVSYAPDEEGNFSDYIELYNGSGRNISLKGFMLSDDEGKRNKWIFPDITLAHGQYLLVYASGKDRTAPALHTSFSLSADGESVVLSDPNGRLLSKMSYSETESDICWSLDSRGEWVSTLPPTPSFSNDANGAALVENAMRSRNTEQVIINEVMYSTRTIDANTQASYDWVELYNASNRVVDLSGWGLSDTASRPRKWQFPQGASIGAGQYMVIQLSGQDGIINNQYHTSFSLSMSEGEAVTLCRPDGTIVDRTPVSRQYAELSFGRLNGQSGFFLFEKATPGANNGGKYYYGRASQVTFSQEGGVQDAPFSLTLTAGEGETIYYTTDCTNPNTASIRYTAPIPITQSTVIRAIAVKNGYMDSLSNTHTYLFGVEHTLPIVSLVSEPDGMFGTTNGMYVNIDQVWSRDAHIEFFTLDGETLFSQGAEISLHGNDARNYQQKTLNVIARAKYGDSRFRAAIFPNRDFTEYQSFLLRPSSEDGNYTRMRCSILSTLADSTTLIHQDTVVAVLYINGDYWGHYNLRERVNAHCIIQWEGWSNPDEVDLVKFNDDVMQGSNRSFRDLLSWLDKHSLKDESNLEYVRTLVDVENYLDYVMLQMYVSNSDLANVKRYRSDEGDGKWRWIIFDLDWAFHNDTNSWADWIGYDKRKPRDGTDPTLFRALMKNPDIKDYFFTLLGERLANEWRSQVIIDRINERQALLEPEMPANYNRWGNSLDRWYEKVDEMREFAVTRPNKLIYYIAECEDMSKAEIEKYFGDALRANPVP